jgi:hypothetical protein
MHIDNAAKRSACFTLPPVFHHLIVDLEKRLPIMHAAIARRR